MFRNAGTGTSKFVYIYLKLCNSLFLLVVPVICLANLAVVCFHADIFVIVSVSCLFLFLILYAI
jgi:hypothetical protein